MSRQHAVMPAPTLIHPQLSRAPVFDAGLISRYDINGPRYTSYPTAPQFHERFGEADLRRIAQASNEDPIPRALSIYVHIPFCLSPCFYCGCTRIITRDRTRADEYLGRLIREIELTAPLFDKDRSVNQVHLGGGTPNFLDAAQMVRLLDAGLVSLDKTLARELGASVAEIPGAGAAGAMGAGAVAFFGARLNPGIETVLDTVRFEERIAGADFVITGEGKLDSQSLRGKVVIGVARRAKRAGVPVFAVVGDVADDIDEAYTVGVSAIFSTNHLAIPFSEAKTRSAKDYRLTIENLFRALAALK